MLRTDTLGFAIGVVFALGTMFFPPPALAQSASELVGKWSLVSSVTERDGTRTDLFKIFGGTPVTVVRYPPFVRPHNFGFCLHA